jgi:hypothetical protein
MLNVLFENRNSSTDAFQCGNVSITGHLFHSKVKSNQNRELIMLDEAQDCRPKGWVLCQDL